MVGDALPHRAFPCGECPVRADNANNPRSKFRPEKWRDLQASVGYGVNGNSDVGAVMFGCHMGAPGTDEDLACAGWLAVFGWRSLTVRLAVILGRLDPDALRPGPNWPPLYGSWHDMVAGQTWQPGDPDDHIGGTCHE